MQKTNKNKVGRPRSTEPLKKRYFRCSDSEWVEISSIADSGSLSGWIRRTLLRAVKSQKAKVVK